MSFLRAHWRKFGPTIRQLNYEVFTICSRENRLAEALGSHQALLVPDSRMSGEAQAQLEIKNREIAELKAKIAALEDGLHKEDFQKNRISPIREKIEQLIDEDLARRRKATELGDPAK